MADVTISSLTRGTPSGGNVVPFSTGTTTLGAPVSAFFQTVSDNIYINTAPINIPGKGIVLSSNDSSGTSIFLNNQTLNKSWRIVSTGSANTGGGSRFGIVNHSDDVNNYKLVILSGGEVGIGTNNPAAKLDVNGSIFTRGYNHIESACLNITQATQTRLQNNTTNSISNAYLEFGFSNNRAFISNNNIFEIITTAPTYGLKIKKSGYLKIDVSQDVVSSTTPVPNYVQLFIYKNGSRVSAHLISPTNGYWDNLVGSQILQIAENDIITMTINCHVNGYTAAIDYHEWSYYNFMFWS